MKNLNNLYQQNIETTFDDEKTSDVMFIFLNETGDSVLQKYYGVCAIFAAQSPKLCQQFFEATSKKRKMDINGMGNHEQNSVYDVSEMTRIIVPANIETDTFELFRKYIFGVPIELTVQNLPLIIDIAVIYEVQMLVDDSINYFLDYVLQTVNMEQLVIMISTLSKLNHDIELRAILHDPKFCLSKVKQIELLICPAVISMPLNAFKETVFRSVAFCSDMCQQRDIWEVTEQWCRKNTDKG